MYTRINNRINLKNQKILGKIYINISNKVNKNKILNFENNNIVKFDNKINLYKKLNFKIILL